MRTQGIFINVSRRNDDLPQLIEEYSEQFNLSKADHLGGYYLMP